MTINQVAAKGETPFALSSAQTFNDPQGPWLILVRDAIFGDATKVDADNDALNNVLADSKLHCRGPAVPCLGPARSRPAPCT